MNRQTENVLWILGTLLVLWFIFRRVNFGTTFQLGPLGGGITLGSGGAGPALPPWLTCGAARPTAPQPTEGNYSQGGYLDYMG